MISPLPITRQYPDDQDFQEVRVDMVDHSTFVFGRVSAAARFAQNNAGQVIRFIIGDSEQIKQIESVEQSHVAQDAVSGSLFDGLFEEVGAAPSGQMPLGGVHPHNIDALAEIRVPGPRAGLAVGRWGIASVREVRGWRRSLTATNRNSAKQVQKLLELRRPIEYISVSVGYDGDLVVGATDLPYGDVRDWLTAAGYERFDVYDGYPERLEYFRLRDGELMMAA